MSRTIVENPQNVHTAEIIVGIPSLDEADSIALPTDAVGRGLQEFFGDRSVAIVNVDNHSEDGTKEAFFATPTAAPKVYVSTPKGVKGKGNNVRNLLQAANELRARAVVMVDADVHSITPNWVRYLAEPVLAGADLVSPLYVRHKYDGTITNHIAYPLLRSLFGLRVRQPIGGDFGFSGKLACALLNERTWTESVGRFGIDIWMTTTAIARNFEVCQAYLGTPKDHRAKDPASDLTPMFTEVVATLFDLVSEFEYHWLEVTESRPSAVYGFGLGVGDQVSPIEIDIESLYEGFMSAFATHRETWERVLSAGVLHEVDELRTQQEAASFYYPTRLWSRILYDYIVANRAGSISQEKLIVSLVPFYHSRILCFVNRTQRMGTREAEEYLEEVTRTFQDEKFYLRDRWSSEAANNRANRLFG